MARVRWKLQTTHRSLFRVLIKHNLKKLKIKSFFNNNTPLTKFKFIYKTHVRNTMVTSFLTKDVVSTITVYKGLFSRVIKPSKLHLGHYLGEFGFTRKPFYFPVKEKKQKSKLLRR